MVTSGRRRNGRMGEREVRQCFGYHIWGVVLLAPSGWSLQLTLTAKNNPTPMSIIPRYRKNMQSIIKHFLTLVGALSIELRCNFYFLLLQIHVSKISIRRVL